GVGAEVGLYDGAREDRQAIAQEIAQKRHAALVPPYDDALIIAGQGTTGREIVEDLAAQSLAPEVIAVTASGGGLTAGIALAVKARMPQARLYTAEPEGFDDHARSFKADGGKTMPRSPAPSAIRYWRRRPVKCRSPSTARGWVPASP